MRLRTPIRVRLVPHLAVAASMLLAATAQAHPGHEEGAAFRFPSSGRQWTLSGGSTPLTASFVAARVGTVRLLDAAGREHVLKETSLSEADRAWVHRRRTEIAALNAMPVRFSVASAIAPQAEPPAATSTDSRPQAARAFDAFKKTVKVRWDERYLYVESDGMPEHPMMKGIRSWQQQVPLPQAYTGTNAWRIPLRPVLSSKPISGRTGLFRGAIALAVNGVPIFNALNNRGEDAYLAGELDEWGGHCGRADDYHYHTAPLHLQKTGGKGQPIAYALDGFPIYGLTNQDGTPVGQLDEFNGKLDGNGSYRYHATLKYPYINGGLRGVVEIRGDQVEPQPRTVPVRPALSPFPGATITEFKAAGENAYRLTCERAGQRFSVEYRINPDATYTFVFIDADGSRRTQTYRRQAQPPMGPPGRTR